jgi:hypothetical protein
VGIGDPAKQPEAAPIPGEPAAPAENPKTPKPGKATPR